MPLKRDRSFFVKAGDSLELFFLRASPPAHTAALRQPPWCSISVGTIRFCESTLDVSTRSILSNSWLGCKWGRKKMSEFHGPRQLLPQGAALVSEALGDKRPSGWSGGLVGPSWRGCGGAAKDVRSISRNFDIILIVEIG